MGEGGTVGGYVGAGYASAPPEYEAPPDYEAVNVPLTSDTAAGIATASIVGAAEGGTDEVRQFLNEVDAGFVEEYYALFMDQGFDSMEVIRTLSDEDLKEIGISKMGHRRKILMGFQRNAEAAGTVTLM